MFLKIYEQEGFTYSFRFIYLFFFGEGGQHTLIEEYSGVNRYTKGKEFPMCVVND